MFIELNSSLKVNEKVLEYYKPKSLNRFTADVTTKGNVFIRHNIDPEYTLAHRNYLEYLQLCWATHHIVVLTPDIVWYTLLCELANIVKEKPEVYRSLFTDSEEKKDIAVFSADPEFLPLDAVSEQLRKLVPNGLTNQFLPRFSTSTKRSIFAHQAAFADTVSPYYSYWTYACGISGIIVDGSVEDWTTIYLNWKNVTEKLNQLEDNQEYYSKVSDILSKIPSLSKIFYENMFRAEKCGSGSQLELFGWFTDLFLKQPDGVRKVDNFSSHVSVVNYENLQTKKKYVLKTGLFYSKVVGDNLEPDFGHIIYEKQKTD